MKLYVATASKGVAEEEKKKGEMRRTMTKMEEK